MISLEKPLPIIGMISRIPGIAVAVKSVSDKVSVKGPSASLLGVNKEDVKRIIMVLEEL
jgi:hypothetical protein